MTPTVYALETWHEDDGPVLWFHLDEGRVNEPPWVGTPLDCDWPLERLKNNQSYYTVWMRLPEFSEVNAAVNKLLTG